MSSLAALRCLLRGLPLFFRAAPRTPLRVLAIVALDTVHVLRKARPMPRARLHALARVVDFQASTNAAWDGKALRETDHRAIRGCRHLEDYLHRLRVLEAGRPAIGGDRRRFEDVRAYREAVVRVSLATLSAIALGSPSLEDAMRAMDDDRDLETLFRMAMQCQILDDLLDYREDLAAGLPSYLTATASLPEAREWTAGAARAYGEGARGAFPLRTALWILTLLAEVGRVFRFSVTGAAFVSSGKKEERKT